VNFPEYDPQDEARLARANQRELIFVIATPVVLVLLMVLIGLRLWFGE
jgi:hypothetical protein